MRLASDLQRLAVVLGVVAAAFTTFVAPPALLAQPRALTHEELADAATSPPIIEIFTMGPGELFVEKFGHAALCVRWPDVPHMDVCYNYGTTDFSQPVSMGWGFVRGEAEFWVETWPRPTMIDHYIRKDRSIWVQTLDDDNSTAAARIAIARKLEFDARLENRDYVYHHFFDNCSTRVRDIVDQAVEGKLAAAATDHPGPTFRDYGYMGFAESSWFIAGANVGIGRVADQRPTRWQAMFLPRILRASLAADLGLEAEHIYARKGPPFPQSGSSGLGWTLLLALAIALPAGLTRALRRRERLGLAVSSCALGTIGLALWLFAIVSPLPELRWNEALLLFVPSDLAIAFLSPSRRQRYGQARVAVIALASLLAAIGIFMQPLWMPLLIASPLMLMLALDR